jgi:hypothetical protein
MDRLTPFAIVVALGALIGVAATALAGSATPPTTKYTFTPLGSWKTHAIDVDKKTVTSMVDKDGDTQAGAVFRITMTEPTFAGEGKQVQTFINAVIAVCGYDGVIMVNSKAYDPTGKLLSELNDIQSYPDSKTPSAPVSEIYKFLCKDVTKKQPRRPSGNNWT